MMTAPRLNAEQRRALAILATADRDGVPQASAHGFDGKLDCRAGQSRAGDPHGREGSGPVES